MKYPLSTILTKKSSRNIATWMMLCILFTSLGCNKNEINVQTGKAEIRTLFARVSESGIIQPTVEVPVAPDVSGEVVQLLVVEGTPVKKGDLLLTIRPDDYKAQLEQIEASLSQARAGYLQAKANLSQSEATLMQDSVALARSEQLFKENVISKVDLENAQLKFNVSKSQYKASEFSVQASYYQVKSAEASRKQARQNLDRTNIYASMDGTLTQLNVELGQRVVGTGMMSGTDILKIADLSSMEVVVEINENDIINVSLNDSARVEVDAFPDEIFYGKVSEIAYSANVSGMASTDQVTNFEVKVTIDASSYQKMNELRGNSSSPFRPGMTALVEIYTRKETDVVAVPIQAVTLRTGKDEEGNPDEKPQEVVFTYKNGKVNQIAVKTGISDDTHIHIKEGLESGSDVVIGPYTTLSKRLRDGLAVSVGEEKSRSWDRAEN